MEGTEEMEEVEEDAAAVKGIVILRTTLTFLLKSQISTVTPTGDVTTIFLITRGKQPDITTQQ